MKILLFFSCALTDNNDEFETVDDVLRYEALFLVLPITNSDVGK